MKNQKMPFLSRWGRWLVALIALWPAGAARAQDAADALRLHQPTTRMVFQRNAQNFASVPLKGAFDELSPAVLVQARAVVMEGGNGRDTSWTELAGRPSSLEFTGLLSMEAGGWYRIEVQALQNGAVIAQTAVERVGVGEVFITAGQSNAANYGARRLSPEDDRVVAGSPTTWRHADDPQPVANGVGGSPWPALGDFLVEHWDVPVAFLSVGVGKTSVQDWQPGGALYGALQQALLAADKNVRAVLWHQGESDTMAGTTSEQYATRLGAIIRQLSLDAGKTVPWFVAGASYAGPNYRANEGAVRAGQQQVCDGQNVLPGPTTDDMLARAWRFDGLHFSEVGLHEHGRRWADVLLQALGGQTPAPLSFSFPSSGMTMTALASISGTLSDTSLSRISLTLRRSDGQYWTGTTWAFDKTMLPARLSGSLWTAAFRLPGAELSPDGLYTLTASAGDGTGDSIPLTLFFVIDRTPPALVMFTAPAQPGVSPIVLNHLASIRGNVQDSGSGIDHVELFLHRRKTSAWWSGTSWSTAAVPLPTLLVAPRWFYMGALPAGANLSDGLYDLVIYAYDLAGNVASQDALCLVDGSVPAAVNFVTPANGASTNGLLAGSPFQMSGTASDNAGGGGIANVQLSILRKSDGLWWSGTRWDTLRVLLPASLQDTSPPNPIPGVSTLSCTWKCTSPLPSGANLSEGTLALYATAQDKAGNRRSGSIAILVDKTAPLPAVLVTPAPRSIVNRLVVLSGTASDSPGIGAPAGSGIARVDVFVRRMSDGLFWTGTTWGARTALATLWNGRVWTRKNSAATPLPDGPNLSDGRYGIYFYAYDKAGNSTGSSTTVTIDQIAPEVALSTPPNGARLSALTSIAGTAQDNLGGSGLERVEVSIFRKSDHQWWNGVAWQTRSVGLAASLSGFTWTRSDTLPQGSNLGDGLYLVQAAAFDKAGNRTVQSNEVAVNGSGF